MKTFSCLVCLAGPLLLAGPALYAEDADAPAERAAEAQRLADEEVKRFAFSLASDPTRELPLTPAPVHRYTHQHEGEVYTNLYVWTRRGRPEVIASISTWYSPRRYRGLAATSLSTEPLIGTRDGQQIWRPQTGGVRLKPIPDADPPGPAAAQRLRAMRALAREFTAQYKRTGRKPKDDKLRLLSTPLYRYQTAEGPELLDGAIFGFASGTAPQLILLIEARRMSGGLQWHYGLAPMNSPEYRVRHRDRQIWTLAQLAPPWANSKNPTNAYCVFPDLQKEGRTAEFADRLRSAAGSPRDGGGR